MKHALIAAAAAILLSQEPIRSEPGPQYRDSKSQAMGRTGAASSQGAASLFLNPAGLGRKSPRSMGLSLDLGLNPVLVDYASWAADNWEYLDDMDSLLARIGPVDNKWAPFSQSNILYGNWQGIAFAALSDSRYDLTVGKAVITPVLGIGAFSDLVLTAGRAFSGDRGSRFGVAFKYVYRLRYDRRLLGTTDEAWYKAVEKWEEPDDGWSDRVSKAKVAADIAETSQGVGINLGLEKDLHPNWTAGLSLLDAPTVLNQRLLRPDLNVGIAYHADVDWIPDLDSKALANFDLQRFMIPGTPWFKQIKAGVALESWMRNRPVAYVALGLNDGYPTFGIRAGYVLHLSYVYVAEEAGTYPGQEKLQFHKLALQLEI